VSALAKHGYRDDESGNHYLIGEYDLGGGSGKERHGNPRSQDRQAGDDQPAVNGPIDAARELDLADDAMYRFG
jgi:hypothetical protein